MDKAELNHKYMLVAGHRLAYLDEGNGPGVRRPKAFSELAVCQACMVQGVPRQDRVP